MIVPHMRLSKRKSKIFKELFAIVGILGSLYTLFHFGFWREWYFPSWKLLILLLLLILSEMIVRAERLMCAVNIVGRKLSFGRAFLANASGDVWGAITPSSIGGEVARLAGMTGEDLSLSCGIKAIAVERLSLILSLFCLVLGLGLYFFLKQPDFFDRNGWHSFFLCGGIILALAILLIALTHYAKGSWRPYLWQRDLFLLSLFHHVVRWGLLPIIVFYHRHEAPSALIYFWSLILAYGLSFMPIPSGGGTVEMAFMSALNPILGGAAAAESLLVWRFLGHYFYVFVGALLTLWGSKRLLSDSQPRISNGDSLEEK